MKKPIVTPLEITEQLCERFRNFLLGQFTGETPLGYYSRFKKVIKAATKEKYFTSNPSEEIAARKNPSKRIKDNLEVEDYLSLLKTPCLNEDVKDAFVFSLYTGLRWVDVKALQWKDISEDVMIKRLVQSKTGVPLAITLHPIALEVIKKMRRKKFILKLTDNEVFGLPTGDGCNAVLAQWVGAAKINKHITWSCARLSFSILLQDQQVDDATVAWLLGHRTTEQVRKTYKRHRPLNQSQTISKLPAPPECLYF